MEPTSGDKRLEDVSTSAPSDIDRSLPPPLPPSIPESCQRPRNRALFAASALVVVLPVATWDFHGEGIVDKSWMGERRQVVKPPDWLAELPDFVGFALTITVLAVFGWLVLEYWLQSWDQWWFIMLGTLCVMGTLAALIGRESTASAPVSDNGFRWLIVYAYLWAYAPLSILLGTSLYKAKVEFAVHYFRRLGLFGKRFKNTLVAIAGGLIGIGIASILLEMIHPGLLITEYLGALTLGLLLVGAIGTAIGLIVLTPFAIAFCGVWLIMFRSADWVMRRKANQ